MTYYAEIEAIGDTVRAVRATADEARAAVVAGYIAARARVIGDTSPGANPVHGSWADDGTGHYDQAAIGDDVAVYEIPPTGHTWYGNAYTDDGTPQ